MLSRGHTTMVTIAAEIGYESEAAFSRAFKKMMGVPPSAWRVGVRGDSSPTPPRPHPA
jgi:AraC-like DNA-binding protein